MPKEQDPTNPNSKAFVQAGAAWVSVDSSIDELGVQNQQRPWSRNKPRANVSTHPNIES